ncbi:hypothetical protein PVAP13_4KG292605 [Panicum virgatum]|uniref:Uncharacterized protein n=1 Tax=Panicum virgatum TaxID=38727 RepID=A0A8T0TUR7_PANVG|nr:hypothetical protein PVAP13_4KG292605 [Panicum virgatum]
MELVRGPARFKGTCIVLYPMDGGAARSGMLFSLLRHNPAATSLLPFLLRRPISISFLSPPPQLRFSLIDEAPRALYSPYPATLTIEARGGMSALL